MRMNNFLSVADLVSLKICITLKLETNMKSIKKRTGTIDTDMLDLFHENKRFRCNKIALSYVVKCMVNPPTFISR